MLLLLLSSTCTIRASKQSVLGRSVNNNSPLPLTDQTSSYQVLMHASVSDVAHKLNASTLASLKSFMISSGVNIE
jgi:hypothetical protein